MAPPEAVPETASTLLLAADRTASRMRRYSPTCPPKPAAPPPRPQHPRARRREPPRQCELAPIEFHILIFCFSTFGRFPYLLDNTYIFTSSLTAFSSPPLFFI